MQIGKGRTMRLSVEVTPEQHQRLKAVAALQGKSLKDYVLDRVLPWTTAEQQALTELEAFLEPRIKAAETHGGEAVSVTQIFEDTLRDTR
jgi:hypothetical protein